MDKVYREPKISLIFEIFIILLLFIFGIFLIFDSGKVLWLNLIPLIYLIIRLLYSTRAIVIKEHLNEIIVESMLQKLIIKKSDIKTIETGGIIKKYLLIKYNNGRVKIFLKKDDIKALVQINLLSDGKS